MTGQVLMEVPALVHESDLQISQLALHLVTDVVKCLPSVVGDCLGSLLSRVVELTQSPLLQGSSLQAVLDFLQGIIHKLRDTCSQDLLDMLTAPVHSKVRSDKLHKQAYRSIAKCVATLVSCRQAAQASHVTIQLANQITGGGTTDGVQLFSLLALGEIGRRCPDVFKRGASQLKPEQIISEAFQSQSEELKTAASYSLGGLAVGNLEKYLPFILKEITAQPRKQYLLLHALKGIIHKLRKIFNELRER